MRHLWPPMSVKQKERKQALEKALADRARDEAAEYARQNSEKDDKE